MHRMTESVVILLSGSCSLSQIVSFHSYLDQKERVSIHK